VFSGEGPRGVDLRLLKDFNEGYGQAVRQRIAGLEPDRSTRLGGAVRHATAGLCREHARHRLLVVLSDGKPNDVDEYEGRFGVEDARQAVVEARLQGLATFCLTVDREAPVYLPRIFGSAGHDGAAPAGEAARRTGRARQTAAPAPRRAQASINWYAHNGNADRLIS